MDEEFPDLKPIPVEPRAPTAQERQLIDFLLDDPYAVPELRAQLESARVVSRCGCGCASVNLEVDAAAPKASFDAADTPFGRSELVPLTADGSDATGKDVEVTLHVSVGYFHELEVWTGAYGDHTYPRPETLRRREQLPIRTEYALAHAIAERLGVHLPDSVELNPNRSGGIEIRTADGTLRDAHAGGRLEATAEGLLQTAAWMLSDLLGDDAVPYADAKPCAEIVGDELRLRYGDSERPALVLSALSMAELDRLAGLWSERFAET